MEGFLFSGRIRLLMLAIELLRWTGRMRDSTLAVHGPARHDLMKYRRNPIRVLITGKSPMDCQILSDAALRFRKQFTVVATAPSKKDILQVLTSAKVDVAL